MEDDVCPSNTLLQPEILLQPEVCNENKCIADEDARTLKCHNCKRKVHFKCTNLPPYQIHRIIAFGKYHSTYICVNCIEVPESYENYNWSEQQYKVKYEQEVEQSRETIRKLNEKIQHMENELNEVKMKTSDENNLPTMPSKSKQKKRRIDENTSEDPSKQELERLREQNQNLTERLNERETALDKTLQQRSITDETAGESRESKSLVEIIERTFNERFKNMQTNLIEIIEEKIYVNSNSKTDNKRSYASTTAGIFETSNKQHEIIPSVQNFRSLMMSTRNEELAEEKDKKERSCNIIIHGKDENKEEKDDSEFVKNMINVIGCNVTPKSVTRIGRPDNNKKRPIKIILQNKQEKDKIMNNLRNLKDHNEFKGISITDDYTMSERQMIKEFATKAKEKSSLEPDGSNYVWRVRGTPKNGLILKRYTKVKQPQEIQN